MRPVKNQRKNARGRTKQPRRSPQAASRRAPARQNFGKREKFRDGPIVRFTRGLRGWFAFRRPMLWLTGSLLAFTFLAALFASGYVANTVRKIDRGFSTIATDAGFGISAVHLAGNNRTSPRTILAALGFEPGQSIFDADIHAARARLMKLDWVADAEVRRRYPDTISVDVVEKVPFALWRSPKGLFVVERSGAPITSHNLSQFMKLPVFAGEGAAKHGAKLVDAIATHRAVAARVKVMERISMRRWNLILDDNVVVKLPELGWEKQLDVLEDLIVDKGVLERDIREIDLRARDNYFFMLRNGDRQQVGRGEKA
ncbi:MAG TPA: FtsQ-type POTRA domain-containing protein [Rhizomicrobium sp.]|jgi:cell division protein FtsQ|nr:FtsQ-type POTRA domain-containing protein [Rhizomicrobium sp.]